MFVFVIATIVCLILSLGVGAVVMVGMKGLYRDRNPRVARGLANAARHMNGDAEPPEAFERLLAAVRS